MTNSTYVPNAGLFAKLLADENVTVTVDQTARTASFNAQSRELKLPNWLGFESDAWYLFIAHEVGHALFTPADALNRPAAKALCTKHQITEGQLHTVLNVLEDIRIERKIRDKYRGLPSFFAKGYAALLERNFFGFGTPEDLRNTKWASYKTLDRLNIYAKVGALVGVKLTKPNDIKWYNAALKAETFEDVLALADEVLSGLKLKKNDPQPPPQPEKGKGSKSNEKQDEKSDDQDDQSDEGDAGSDDSDDEDDDQSDESDEGGEDPEESDDEDDNQSDAGKSTGADSDDTEESDTQSKGSSDDSDQSDEESIPETARPDASQGDDPEADDEQDDQSEQIDQDPNGSGAEGGDDDEAFDPSELESETRDKSESMLEKSVKRTNDWSTPTIVTLPVSLAYLNEKDQGLDATLAAFFGYVDRY